MNKYWIKAFVLKSWLYEEYKRVAVQLFAYNNQRFLGGDYFLQIISREDKLSIEECFDIDIKYSHKYYHLWKECKRIYSANLHRVVRLKNRLNDIILNHKCLFLTLTFREEVLENTSSKTRRYYVQDFLKSFNVRYVANIDFGDDHLYKARDGTERQATNREHYHAVLEIDKIDYHLWKYGRINGQRIRNQTNDLTKISKYVSKLTNHAIKESTKRSVIMYSRSKKT